MVLGIPTYGRSFTLSSSSKTPPNAYFSGAGNAGPILNQAGFLGYQEICLNLKNNGWTEVLNFTKKLTKGSFINHVDRAGGGGVSGKTMFVHMGGGRGKRLVHVDKNVLWLPILHTRILVSVFEQLHVEFVD